MNKIHDISKVIETFFKNQYSKAIRQKFAWWLIHHTEQEASEETLQQLWEKIQNTPANIAQEDLIRFQQSLRKERQRHLLQKYRKWGMAAVWIACITLTVFITYYVALSHFKNQQTSITLTQVNVPEQAIKTIYLSDSTCVTLNSGSTLIYPTFFTENTRTVFLLGEASFDVKENKDKPFIVQTRLFSVTALGTHFSVNSYDKLSYNNATLESGSIQVDFHQLKNIPPQGSFILKPNKTIECDKQTGAIQIKSTDAALMLSWTEGKLVFDGVRFIDIIDCLERKYGVQIVCKDITKMTGIYHAKFEKRESIKEILNLLCKLSHPFEYHIHGNTIDIIPE